MAAAVDSPSRPSTHEPRLGRLGYLISFLSGAAMMASEIAAGRLVAPYYGTSNLVWALVIGAVLGSLALGQWLGGRISRWRSQRSLLSILILASALLLFLLPLVAAPMMRGSLSQFVEGRAGGLALGGVLITILIGLPMIALGALSPLLIQGMVVHPEQTGRTAGRLYAVGTVGGLLGTYASGLILIPWIGTRATFWACAALLALGAAVLGVSRSGRSLTVSLGIALGLAAALGGRAAARPGLLLERETAYNHVRVTDGAVRRLLLNEGFSTQSIYPVDGSLPLESVWGWYAAAPSFTRAGAPRAVLLLGLGAGTAARIYRTLYPSARITGVELDGELVAIGRRLFALPASVEVVVDDARAFLRRDRARYEVVIVDAFQFPYVPFQLTTLEFFRDLEARLSPGGVVMLNLGRDQGSQEVVDAVAHTAAQVFPEVWGSDLPSGWNTILVLGRHREAEQVGLARLGLAPEVERRLARLPRPRRWRSSSSSPILTDDHAPIEALTDRIVLRRLLGGS